MSPQPGGVEAPRVERESSGSWQTRVTENLGLVRVHLQHRLGPLRAGRRHRDIDDLFQEGCLELVRAARSYDPACEIPFASFALLRIRRAIHRALEETDQERERRLHRAACRHALEADADDPRPKRGPKRGTESQKAPAASGTPGAHPQLVGAASDLNVLGARYRSAVDDAARQLLRRSHTPERARVVRQLVQRRLRVLDAEDKPSLRQITRDTASSYGRVRACEMQMLAIIREQLVGELGHHP